MKVRLAHLKHLILNRHRRSAILIAATILIVISILVYTVRSLSTTYVGKALCPNCDNMQTRLTINGDGTYAFSSVSLNDGLPFTQKGSWQIVWKDSKQLYQLKNNHSVSSYYEVINANTIHMVTVEGSKITAPFSLVLTKM